MKQKIILTALPNGLVSKGNGNNLKISAALSLQVEDANTTLQNVPDMLKWAQLAKNGKFIVYINNTPVQANVISSPVDDTLWKNLFAPTVKVKSFVQEDLSNMPIVSYPVKHIISYVQNIVAQMGKDFADDLPDSNYYTENATFKAISDYGVADYPKQRGREKISLDNLIIKLHPEERIKTQLRKNKAIPFNQNPNPTFDFAQLKNFHGLYDKKPVTNYIAPQKPDFEFHEMLSVIAAYPELLRKLGLVFDLEITNTGNIAINSGSEPNIRVVMTGINYSIATTLSSPATATVVTAKHFYTKPSAGSLIDKGHLKLNTDAFTVFQLDTDGAGLKMCQMIDGLQLKKAKHIYHAVEGMVPSAQLIPLFNNEAPRKEGTPVNRSSGIGIAKNGMAASLQTKFVKMNGLKPALVAIGINPSGVSGTNTSFVLPNEILYADDLNLGYRMDIQPDDMGGKWFSLHKRKNKYSFINSNGTPIEISNMSPDEGYIQIGAAEENTDLGKQLKVGEAFARWEGWSLSVPPPGSALNDPLLDKQEIYDKSKPGDKVKEENKYRTPNTADFKLNVLAGIEKGTLPKLRFGKKYSIKVRTVDAAGNSVPHDFSPENPGVAIVPNIRYMRYEPVDAPFLVLGNNVKDGESAEVMVIRSNESMSVEQFENNEDGGKYKPESIRHVKPPRCTVERATTHSMLDKGFGEANAAQASAYYQKIVAEKDPLFKEEDNKPNMTVVDGNQKTITVEYLADPLAAGVTFFLSSNDPNPKIPNPDSITRRVSFYFDEEVTTDAQANKTASTDEWFDPKTFRVMLKEGPPGINWQSSSRTLIVTLQKGAIVKMNYACFWRPDDIIKHSGVLDMMGMNNLNGTVGQKIAKGQHWMFSPWREITFVHAIQQPLTKLGNKKYPQIAQIESDRNYGDHFALLNTKLLVHGPSTGQLDIEADWTEWVDDVEEPAVEQVSMRSKVIHFTTLYLVFEYVFGELIKNNPFKGIKHLFNDTKHRMVNYKSIATTRYREYFFNLITQKKDAFKITTEEDKTTKVNILSSARPVAPQIEYVIPTFEWDRVQNGNLTLTGRASGMRVYLRRPWYSSGEGEQLAVVLFQGNPNANVTMVATPPVNLVTTWGTDPTKLSAPLPGGIAPNQNNFVNIKPENKDSNLSVVESPGVKVSIVAYDVKYDLERQLYYVDIGLNVVAAYYPFVRLALARYQRNSLRKGGTDCCLSAIVQADYIQVPAPRASSLQFGNSKNNITAAISGTVPNVTPQPDFRTKVEFVIEPIEVPSSEDTHITINAKPIDTYSYVLQPADVKNFGFYHKHVFNLPAAYASKPYRVKVLEYEMIIYDPLKPNPNPGGVHFSTMPLKDRLVFADVYEVNN
ncbi:MAG TPA: hypothetical protein PKC72_06850 [Chitinophagaceae bacterium]|mgnify:CR=1 FL=1|nr:hypothetical protein [Chitinophagaceae bacterium]